MYCNLIVCYLCNGQSYKKNDNLNKVCKIHSNLFRFMVVYINVGHFVALYIVTHPCVLQSVYFNSLLGLCILEFVRTFFN